MSEQTIVIAWIHRDGYRATGRYLDRYGLEPELESVPRARACVWLRAGSDADVRAAREYLERSEPDALARAVYTYPTNERDPLARARESILMDLPART